MITGIIVALPEELATLTKKKIARGSYAPISDRILVSLSGVGPKNAARATKQLITHGAERIISWGCAAALDANLRPGDLTLANQLIAENGDTLSVPADWLEVTREALADSIEIHTGWLVESSNIITSSQQKIALRDQTHGYALDMESFACADIARQAALPFLAIRVIADPVDMDLPEAVIRAIDKNGKLVLSKLLRFLLTHPAQIPVLIRLGTHFLAATSKLKLVAGHLDAIVSLAQPGAPAR